MKKRLMSLLLSAAMIMSMIVVPAAAADPVTVSVDSVSGKPGDTVTVGINLENLADDLYIGAFQIDVAFDADDLEPILQVEGRKSFYVKQNTEFWAGGTFQSSLKDGVISLGAINSDGWPGSGQVGSIQFTIKPDVAVEETELTVSLKKVTLLELDNSQTDITADMGTEAGVIDIIFPVTATTGDAEQKTVTSAVLNGSYVENVEGLTIDASGIKWGTAENALTNTVAFGAEVTGAQGATIYYQAYATVSGVEYVGDVKNITLDGPKASSIEISGEAAIEVPCEVEYTAAVKDQFGGDFATDVAWSVSAAEGVSIDATGKLTVNTKAQSGTVTITATAGEASDTFDVAITRPAPIVNEITVAGSGSVAVPTAAVGEATVELTVTGIDQFGEPATLTDVDWSISEAAGVSIANGVLTVTNKAQAGTITVTAQVGDAVDSFELTITKAPSEAATIVVSGPTAGDIKADEANTLTYTAAVTDQYGDAMDITPAWDVNSREVSIANGVLTIPAMIKSQTVTITAASGSASDTIDVALTRLGAVAETVEISGEAAITLPDLATGSASVNFTAVVTDNWGDVMPAPEVTWAIDPAISGISIDADGKLTVTTEAGEADFSVTATCGDATDSFAVSVKKAASVATEIAFSADAATMTIPTDDNNKVETFAAVVTDQYGEEMAAEVAYTFATADEFVSADANTVTVKKGATAGTTYTLTASVGALTDTLTITVVDIEITWDYTVSTSAVYGTTWSKIVKLGKNGSATLEGSAVKGTFEIVDKDVAPKAGEQTFTLKFTSDDGVYVVTKTDVATVAPKALTMTWTAPKSITYTGELPEITATLKGALAGDDVSVNVLGLVADAGTYEATAELAGADKDNYTLTATPKAYTIKPADIQGFEGATPKQISIVKANNENVIALIVDEVKAYGFGDVELPGTITIERNISELGAGSQVSIEAVFTPDSANYTAKTFFFDLEITEGEPQVIVIDRDAIDAAFPENENGFNFVYGMPGFDLKQFITVTRNGAVADNAVLSFSADIEEVTVDPATGYVTFVDSFDGFAHITVSVDAYYDEANDTNWVAATEEYAILLGQKELTFNVSNVAAIEIPFNNGNSIDIAGTTMLDGLTLDGIINEDDVALDLTNAYMSFEDTYAAGATHAVVFDNFTLTGADAAKYYINALEGLTVTVTKADPVISFYEPSLKQKVGNVTDVIAHSDPYSETLEIIVEYLMPAVAEVPCAHADEDPACDHSDDCGYVAAQPEQWVTTVPTEKGDYAVRAYTAGDANLNAVAVENAVTATLKITKASSGGGGGGSAPVKPPVEEEDEKVFIDVAEDAWYFDAIDEIFDLGLMEGISDNEFGPDMNLTRGMVVQILWAMEGKPASDYELTFEDVASNAWYTEAVRWAAANGIAAGYSAEEFGPADLVTREQLAVMLCGYARFKDATLDVGDVSSIMNYSDIESISDWAIPAMQWACGEGLISGTPEGNLLPQSVATRAQAAVILVNFEKLING